MFLFRFASLNVSEWRGHVRIGAVLGLLAVAPSVAAVAPDKPHIVAACSTPVFVGIHIGATGDFAARDYRLETCGTGTDRASEIPDGGFKTLSFAGDDGTVEIHLELRNGERALAYEARAVKPGETVSLQRVGHHQGADVTVTTMRDPRSDLLALHTVDEAARDIAADIARAKQLRITDIDQIGNSRVTFQFDAIPSRVVFSLLADVSDRMIWFTDEHEVSVSAPMHFSDDWKKLYAARKNAVGRERSAIEAQMLTLIGTPQRREDVTPIQELELRSISRGDDDKRVVAPQRQLVEWIRVRSCDAERDPAYADALFALAEALAQNNATAEAATVQTHAIAIIERVDGPMTIHLADPLIDQAAIANELGKQAAAREMLTRAISLGNPTQKPRAMLALAALHFGERRYDDAAATLDAVYPLLPEHANWYEEDEAGHPSQMHDAFVDLESKLMPKLRLEIAEIHRRRLVALETRCYGADSIPAAYEHYALGRILQRQNKLEDAAEEMAASLTYAAKQTEPVFLHADVLMHIAQIRLAQRKFGEAAGAWRDMAALRAKVYGSHNVRVALALREVAMLETEADRNGETRDALQRAADAERGEHVSPAEAVFAKAAGDLKEGLDYDLVYSIAEQLRDDIAQLSALDETQRVRFDALAKQFEDYAMTTLRMQNDTQAAAILYTASASLRSLSRGRDQTETQASARKAIELWQQIGRQDTADKLRQGYVIER